MTEGAAMLAMSRSALYARVADGTIRTVLIGGVRLLPATEIDRLLGESD
jgi:predicted DNA-binding transcriptional regulator AlpA